MIEVARYDYKTLNGQLLFQKIRYEPKTFRIVNPVTGQGNNGHAGALYNCENLNDIEGKRVYIVEGEKDVDTMTALGLLACTSGGASSWPSKNNDLFIGVDVCILPDNDDPGKKYAEKVRDELSTVARSVQIKYCPEPHKDISDWVQAGATAQEIAGLFAEYVPKKTEPPKFELIQIRDIIANPVNISWMIKGVLESGGVSLISGAYGSGKSFVAFDMAFCIATGMDWHGNKTTQAPVIVLAGEGHSGIGDRFEALTLHYGEDCPSGLYLSKHPARMTDRVNAAWVKTAVDEICPDAGVIIVDTLNRNFGEGDENSTRDMSNFITSIDDNFRGSGKTVLIVHHTGHAENGRARGSSVLPASCEGEFLISKNKSDDGLILECKKQKNAKRPDDMLFSFKSIDLGRVDDDGEAINSLVLEYTGETTQRSKRGKLLHHELLCFDALKEALTAWGSEPPAGFCDQENVAGFRIVSVEHWRIKAYKALGDGKEQNTKKQIFRRVREKLVTTGLAGFLDDYFWII